MKIGIILVVIAMVASVVAASEPTFNFYTEVRSALLVTQSVKLADEVVQNDLTVKWKSGTYVELTLTAPFADAGVSSKSFGNEFDLAVGAPLRVIGLPGSVEVATYQLARLDQWDNEFISFSWSVSVGPGSITAQRMQGVGPEHFVSGWFIKADYAKSFKLGSRVRIIVPLRLIWDNGVGGKDGGFIGRIKPEVDLTLGSKATLYVGWEGYKLLSNQHGRKSEHAGRVGLRFSF